MEGFKASVVSIILTVVTCLMIVSVSKAQTIMGFKIVDNTDENPESIVKEEGAFPPSVNFVYGEGRDIYHIKYDTRDSVEVYDILSGKSEMLLTPINTGYKINAFSKSGDCLIWEEEKGLLDDGEEGPLKGWAIYFRKGNKIFKIDEKKYGEQSGGDAAQFSRLKLSVYESKLVYKSYDSIPGTDGEGAVIKLYDLADRSSKIIFSLSHAKDIVVSDPCIYKNYIVWSTYSSYAGDELPLGNIYVYNIKSNSYNILTRQDGYIEPLIWDNYIVCGFYSSSGPGVAVIDINTGSRKIIASSDYTISPRKVIHDYMVGEGYITWNSSYAESVEVYDIKQDRIYHLKKAENRGRSENSLLNIKIYGKTILYIDHIFNSKNGQTISETNRYIILR